MKTVWTIDDDEEMSHAIGLMLKLLEYEVTAFYNVRSAAQLFASGRRPDLLILDINMPEVTGLDMIEFLRRRADTKDLPIVMLSSEASDVMVDRAMDLGADTYVMKPVTLDELEAAMSDAFDKHSIK